MTAALPPVDPVALTADLIRCPSVTPAEGGGSVFRFTLPAV